MAKENDMSLIFAVTGNSIKSSYEEFSKLISGSSVENLEEDSSNIVELIRDTFNVRQICLRTASSQNIKSSTFNQTGNCLIC